MSRALRGRLIVCITAAGLIAPAAVRIHGTSQGKSQDQLAQADFRDIGDRVRSDGKGNPCGIGDYVAGSDPCYATVFAEPDRTASKVLVGGTYFLRTVGTNQKVPTRWLVLDFVDGVGGAACPGLDTRLLTYDGRDPAAFSPEDTNLCVDLVEARFIADGAFKPGATATPVRIIIDGPDVALFRHKNDPTTQWNAKFELDFVNPVSITVLSADMISIETTVDAAADLWMLNHKTLKKETPLGRYKMPFQVTVVRLP